ATAIDFGSPLSGRTGPTWRDLQRHLPERTSWLGLDAGDVSSSLASKAIAAYLGILRNCTIDRAGIRWATWRRLESSYTPSAMSVTELIKKVRFLNEFRRQGQHCDEVRRTGGRGLREAARALSTH